MDCGKTLWKKIASEDISSEDKSCSTTQGMRRNLHTLQSAQLASSFASLRHRYKSAGLGKETMMQGTAEVVKPADSKNLCSRAGNGSFRPKNMFSLPATALKSEAALTLRRLAAWGSDLIEQRGGTLFIMYEHCTRNLSERLPFLRVVAPSLEGFLVWQQQHASYNGVGRTKH